MFVNTFDAPQLGGRRAGEVLSVSHTATTSHRCARDSGHVQLGDVPGTDDTQSNTISLA